MALLFDLGKVQPVFSRGIGKEDDERFTDSSVNGV